MQIQVLLFATLKDLAGEKKIDLALPGETTSVKHVRQQLINRYPDMEANMKVALASVNEEFAFDADTVKDGDEVAFFPPVSGGSDEQPELFRLPNEPVDHDEIVAAITTPATGAVCLFSGMVRG